MTSAQLTNKSCFKVTRQRKEWLAHAEIKPAAPHPWHVGTKLSNMGTAGYKYLILKQYPTSLAFFPS